MLVTPWFAGPVTRRDPAAWRNVVATADWINHAILSYEEASAGVRALARRGLLVERAHGVLVLSLAARNGFAAAYGTRKRMGVFKLWDVADALIARQAHAREIRDVDVAARSGLGQDDLLEVRGEFWPIRGVGGQLIGTGFNIPGPPQHRGGTIHGIDTGMLLEALAQQLHRAQKIRRGRRLAAVMGNLQEIGAKGSSPGDDRAFGLVFDVASQ